MIRRPPRSTRTDTLLPYTTLFRSDDWRSLECNGAADPGRRNLHRSSRLRLQPLRTPGERHRARIAAIRAACRPDQDFTLDSSKPLGRAPPAIGQGLSGMGSRHVPRLLGPFHRDGNTLNHRRLVGPKFLDRRIGSAPVWTPVTNPYLVCP